MQLVNNYVYGFLWALYPYSKSNENRFRNKATDGYTLIGVVKVA